MMYDVRRTWWFWHRGRWVVVVVCPVAVYPVADRFVADFVGQKRGYLRGYLQTCCLMKDRDLLVLVLQMGS